MKHWHVRVAMDTCLCGIPVHPEVLITYHWHSVSCPGCSAMLIAKLLPNLDRAELERVAVALDVALMSGE